MKEVILALQNAGLIFKPKSEELMHIFKGEEQVGCVRQEEEDRASFHFHLPGKIKELASPSVPSSDTVLT